MSTLNQELVAVLESAESKILELVARAAENRDYVMIERAKRLAERLNELQLKETLPESNGLAQSSTKAVRKKKGKTKVNRGKIKRKKKAAYPRFEVKHGALYKIGWSKRNQSEYTHRIPLDRAREVIYALDQLAIRAKNIVSAQHIFEWLENQKCTVSSYQVYLVLALLKEEKLIAVSGRDGYKLSTGLERQTESIFRQIERE